MNDQDNPRPLIGASGGPGQRDDEGGSTPPAGAAVFGRAGEAWQAGQKEAFRAAVEGEPLETSLGALVRTAVEALGPGTRAAFCISEDGGATLRHVVGMGDEYARAVDGFPIGRGALACGLAVATGEPVVTVDVMAEPRWEPWRPMAERFGYRGCWSFPIHSASGAFIGTFAVYSAAPREATPRDLELASLLTDAAAIIISRHRESEARRRAEAELAAELDAMNRLRELSDRLLSTPDLATALGEVLDAAIALHGADRGTVQVYDPEADGLRYAAARGFDLPALPPIDRGFHSTCAAAFRTGEPVIVADIPADPRFAAHVTAAATLGYRAALSFPLTTRRAEFVGVLTVHFTGPRPASDRELRWAALYAPLAAHLIERRRAEAAVRTSEEKYRLLFTNMSEGFVLAEMIWDEHGDPSDWRYLEVNPAWAQTGVPVSQTAGRTAREVNPKLEPGWIETYGRVVRTGRPASYEAYAAGFGRWFETFAFKHSENRFGLLFRDVTDRKRAQEALRASEEKYRALFNSMDEAYAVVDVIRDEATGRWADFAFVEVNPAFVKHTGVPYPVGRTATELLGAPNPRWAEVCGRVVETGEPVRIEEREPVLDRVFDLCIFRLGGPGSRRVAALFTDVTARKRAEDALRAGEVRQAFLLSLSDAIGPLGEAEEIRLTAVQVLGRHLGANRVAYAEDVGDGRSFDVMPNYVDGVADVSGRYRYADYGPDILEMLQAGRLRIQPDIQNDERLGDAEKQALASAGVGASLNVPLVKDGRLVAFLGINYLAAHEFQSEEIGLAEETADRTWAAVERAKAEAALQTSEARLRLALAAARMGVWTLDLDAGVHMRDANLNRLLGLEPEETTQPFETFLAHIHPDDRRAVREAFAASSREGLPLNVEFRVVRPDGSVRWLRDQGDVFGAATPGSRRMAGVCVDVTDLKAVEGALRESEGRLRAVAANLPNAAVFVVDPALRYLMAEGQALRGAGFAPADLEGKSITEATGPDLAAEHVPSFRRALAGEDVSVEHASHGRHYATHLAPLRDPAGRTVAALAVSHDITDRVRAEEGVRRSEERLRRILASATDFAILTLAPDRTVTSWSPGAALAFGYDEAEMIGRSGDVLFTPEDRAAAAPEDEARTALREGRAADERWHLRADGSRFYASGVLTPLGDGGSLGFVKVLRDLTDRKRMEDELRRAHDELERRVAERTADLEAEIARRKDLTRRLATAQEDERQRVSRDLHDSIGQLLAGLSLAFKAVETAGELPPAATARLAEAHRVVEALGKEVHGLAVRLRPTSLDDLGLEAALAQFVGEWSARNGVRADFRATGVGPERLPSEIETTLYRVVQEALTNVARHARASIVSVVVSRPDGLVSAVIEDDGAGFDPDSVPPGRLGLMGMRERVALVGGELEIESTPGTGTTVYVRIPIPASGGGGPTT